MSQDTENIKSRLNIVDVVSSYIKLEKAGVNFKARCPFHAEKSPSFMVSPSRDSYHCFGCSKGGDIFSFVQDIEGVEFPEALALLAERAGVELSKTPKGEQTDRRSILRVLEVSALYYQAVLKKRPEALNYLKKRGLKEETIESFKIGFAPDTWTSLHDFLRKKGVSAIDMEKAGLILKSAKMRGGHYDRFRGRIMFPINDASGRVVGFSARIFGNEEERKNEGKYINSPETSLYDKSKILYGFDRAKTEIRKSNFCVLVEGQMDLILSHQAGFLNTVAVSGTALTEKSLKQIGNLTDNLIMAFDADLAGIEASKRAIGLSLSLGLDVKIVLLPSGQDPADVILENPEDWKKRLEKAKHVINFYLETLSDKQTDKRLLARDIKQEVYPYIKKLAHRTDQAHFISEISQMVGLSEQVIWEDVKNIKDEIFVNKFVSEKKEENKILSRKEIIANQVFGLMYLFEAEGKKDKASDIEKKIKDFMKQEGFDGFNSRLSEKKTELMHQVEFLYGPEVSTDVLEELVQQFEREFLKDKLNQALILLKQAEKSGQSLEVDKWLKTCQDVSEQLKKLKN